MYSEIVLAHFHQPHHMGTLEHPDATGQVGMPGEGPYLILQLATAGDQIKEARFQSYGCPAAIACANWMCTWVEGKTLEIVKRLEASDLARLLGGLPLGKEHCAQRAVQALRLALSQAEQSASKGGNKR